jgi:CDP-4-dehydro-6-deoxyglucose reductase, E1
MSPPSSSAVPNGGWRDAICTEWRRRRQEEDNARAPNNTAIFPLALNPFGEDEIAAMTDVLLTGRLTLGKHIEEAERLFAEAVGAPFAVFVNSGSSANLLAVAAITNKLRPGHLEQGDEVLVPAVCWSTSAFPLIQLGLKPVFVDVDPRTLNADIDEMEKRMSPRVKAVMAVHVLGNSCCMSELLAFVRRHNLVLVEDTCESLGSTFVDRSSGAVADKRNKNDDNNDNNNNVTATNDDSNNANNNNQQKVKFLGTAGDFGTYSFYFSHHITSGEGGMVVCQNEEDYNYLRCLRAHGWTRHLTNSAEVEAQHPTIDPRFLFVNVGYNLRPLEVQGAMLKVQLAKMHAFNDCRRDNMTRITTALRADPRFGKVMAISQAAEDTNPAWFGVGALLHRPYMHQLTAYLDYLTAHGVENRPIISGNFVRQPAIAAYCPGERPEDYPGAEVIHTRGFFIGVHQVRVNDATVAKLVDVMLGFEFVPRKTVLVTGASGMLGRHVRDQVLKTAMSPEELEAATDSATAAASAATTASAAAAEWVFVTSKDADLCDKRQVESLFKRHQPTHVLHCAAKLQAIQVMTDRPIDFWLANVTMNNNVLSVAHEFQSWTGPIKVVSVLSTVMFPKDAEYPMTASPERLYSGVHHPAAESYAAAKRALCQLSQWYRKQHGDAFTCVLPGNFFGEYGDFDEATAPLVNALIARADAAVHQQQQQEEEDKEGNAATSFLKVMGTGRPERQVMHASDLARACLWALEHYDESEPIIVAGEEVSVRHMAELVCAGTGFKGGLSFDEGSVDGPLRRTADTSQLQKLCPGFKFTPLAQSIQATVAWYRSLQQEQQLSAADAAAAKKESPAGATAFVTVGASSSAAAADKQRASAAMVAPGATA